MNSARIIVSRRGYRLQSGALLVVGFCLGLFNPAHGQTLWTNAFPTFYDIAASEDAYVVAGDMPVISRDLVTWEPAGPIRSNAWTGIVYAQDQFVAISGDGELAVSKDGRDWALRDLRPLLPGRYDEVRYQGIEFIDGKFFVLARGLLVSTNAKDWDVFAKASNNEAYRGVAKGNNVLVAVGNRGSVARSLNGVAWSVTKPIGFDNLRTVAFYRDHFYVPSVKDEIFTSQNGISWSREGSLVAVTLLPTEDRLLGAVRPGLVHVTADGVTWESMQTPSQMFLTKLRFLNGEFFCAGAPGVILRSPDGTNWTQLFPEGVTTERFYSAAANSTNRLVLGRDGAFLHSRVGEQWKSIARPDSAWFYSVAAFRDQFVGAGWEGKVYTSPDGLDWTAQGSGTTNALFTLSVANDRLLAGGRGFILSSTNAVDWEETLVHPNLSVSGVLHGNGRYVAAGVPIVSGEGAGGSADGGGGGGAEGQLTASLQEEQTPSIMVSTDLKEWTSLAGDYGSVYATAYGNGIFLLAGVDVFISEDGLNWVEVEPARGYIEGAIFVNGKFYLASYPGVLFVSSDGRTWETIPCATGSRLWGLAATPYSLIAVGDSGKVVEAPFDLYFKSGGKQPGLGIQQKLYGGSGSTVTIQSSSDLRSWSPFLEMQDPPNPLDFTLPSAAGALFLRAIREAKP